MVVVQHIAKSNTKKELKEFEKKVAKETAKGLYIINANSVWNPSENSTIHYAYLVDRNR